MVILKQEKNIEIREGKNNYQETNNDSWYFGDHTLKTKKLPVSHQCTVFKSVNLETREQKYLKFI